MTSSQEKIDGYQAKIKQGEERKKEDIVKIEAVSDPDGKSVQQKVIKKGGIWTVDGRPREKIDLISHTHPSNLPHKSLITLLITLPARGATPSHTHNGAAVTALMLRGSTINQMSCSDDGGAKARVYREGESWYEAPGCHHMRSENASEEEEGGEEAKFYAVMVVDDEVVERDGMAGLFVLDAEVEEQGRAKEERSEN